MKKTYIATIHQDAPGRTLGVSFHDFDGCISAGNDLADAHRMGAEALQFHIDGMLEDCLPIPEPSDHRAVLMGETTDDKPVAFLYVDADVPTLSELLDDACVRLADIYALDLYAMGTLPDGIGGQNLAEFISDAFRDPGTREALISAGMESIITDVEEHDEDLKESVSEAFNSNPRPHGFLARAEVAERHSFRPDGGCSIRSSVRSIRVIHGDTLEALAFAALRFAAECEKIDRKREGWNDYRLETSSSNPEVNVACGHKISIQGKDVQDMPLSAFHHEVIRAAFINEPDFLGAFSLHCILFEEANGVFSQEAAVFEIEGNASPDLVESTAIMGDVDGKHVKDTRDFARPTAAKKGMGPITSIPVGGSMTLRLKARHLDESDRIIEVKK